jgi:hypothetical protein
MNYKKMIASRRMRLIILRFLDFIPDRLMIYIQYYISTGRVLNLRNPRRFTEKLQWYKLYYRNKLMTKCADKYMVREYVMSKGLEDILIRLYGVYDKPNQINFKDLPNSFILKTTNGSHTNIPCVDKSNLNIKDAKKNLNKWIEEWAGKVGREWAYYDIKPKIICEKLLESNGINGLDDYKFFCFNGEPYCLYVVVDRGLKNGLRLGIYDLEFNKLKYRRSDIDPIEDHIEKPKNFEKMVEISRILSKDFPHVRVDLYNIDSKIYFGELTFYDGSGYKEFKDDEFDNLLGDKFKLPKKHKVAV